jgi:hypothetical protein
MSIAEKKRNMTLDLYGLEKAGLALIKPFLINI